MTSAGGYPATFWGRTEYHTYPREEGHSVGILGSVGRLAVTATAQSLRITGAGLEVTRSVTEQVGRTVTATGQAAAGQVGRTVGAAGLGMVERVGEVAFTAVPRLVGAMPVSPAEATIKIGQVFSGVAGELADAGPLRFRRRIWRQDGRAHVEVRGLTGAAAHDVSRAVTSALSNLKGMHWAEVNAVTQQVLIAFDEETVDLDLVLDTIESVEEAHGIHTDSFERSKPEIPGDRSAEYSAVVSLAAGVVGVGLASAGKLSRLPLLPRALRIPIVLAESQPRLRIALEDRLGKIPSELAFQLGNSAAYVATADPYPIAMDLAQRALAFVEVRSRRLVWERRAPELAGFAPAPADTERPPRPVPLPSGPIERMTERSSLASLTAAGGVLAWTRDPGKAADLMLATVPKAAAVGREGFASMLGHELSQAGVLTMDRSALRRLDRISVVVIDSEVLAYETIGDDRDPDEPDPLADALIGAARSHGRRLLLTDHPAAAELASWADDTVPSTANLADRVRELQAEGEGVLVISARDDAALAAADVGVTVVRGLRLCWSADFICGPGLADAWRILRALDIASQVSERSARLAMGGAALGALLATSGRRHTGTQIPPAHSAVGAAVLGGALSARRLSRLPSPEPAPRGRWHEMTSDQVMHRLREAAANADRPAETPPGERVHELREAAVGVVRDPKKARGDAQRTTGIFTEVAHAVNGELRDPLTPVLAFGAAASAVVGSSVDAALVGGVMVGNALIGGVQRVRAERALRALLFGNGCRPGGSPTTGRSPRCPPTGSGWATSSRSTAPTWCPPTCGCSTAKASRSTSRRSPASRCRSRRTLPPRLAPTWRTGPACSTKAPRSSPATHAASWSRWAAPPRPAERRRPRDTAPGRSVCRRGLANSPGSPSPRPASRGPR